MSLLTSLAVILTILQGLAKLHHHQHNPLGATVTGNQPVSVTQCIRDIRHSSASTGQDPLSTAFAASDRDIEVITEQLQKLLKDPSSTEVKPLKNVNRKQLKEEISLVNSCIAGISTFSITATYTRDVHSNYLTLALLYFGNYVGI